jgi:SAM-dependent methyltransferase
MKKAYTRNKTNYDAIAAEYYNDTFHPTCRDLRKLSEVLLNPFLADLDISAGTLLEVGTGRSVLAPVAKRQKVLPRTVLLDSSPAMLSYSRDWEADGARLIVAPAEATGLPDRSISVVVASLGDPYNHTLFWEEMQRVLMPEGHVLFTSPAFEWSTAFRAEGADDVAEFLRSDGASLSMPSYVYDKEHQTQVIEQAGLKCVGYWTAGTEYLGDTIAPKLQVISPSLPAVTFFVAQA